MDTRVVLDNPNAAIREIEWSEAMLWPKIIWPHEMREVSPRFHPLVALTEEARIGVEGYTVIAVRMLELRTGPDLFDDPYERSDDGEVSEVLEVLDSLMGLADPILHLHKGGHYFPWMTPANDG